VQIRTGRLLSFIINRLENDSLFSSHISKCTNVGIIETRSKNIGQIGRPQAAVGKFDLRRGDRGSNHKPPNDGRSRIRVFTLQGSAHSESLTGSPYITHQIVFSALKSEYLPSL
jgi:hypothetical protein